MIEYSKAKICSKCGIKKDRIEFFKNSKSKDGIRSACKDCEKKVTSLYNQNNKDKQRKYYQKNKEKILLQSKKYQEQNKEKIKEYNREYQEQNKEKIKEYRASRKEITAKRNKEYNAKNKEILQEKNKKYREENKYIIAKRNKIYKEKNKEYISQREKQYRVLYRKTESAIASQKNYQHKRRAKVKQGDVTTDQLIHLEKNATHCYWRNKQLVKGDIHIDHYVPLNNGGEHTLSNLVVSCKSCNITKQAKDPLEFAQSLGRLL